MSLWSLSLEATQDEDESYSLGYATRPPPGQPITNAVPIDFTGASAIFTIKQTSAVASVQLLRLDTSGSQVFFGSQVVDGVHSNTINVNLTSVQTEAFPVGEWYFDIQVLFPGGTHTYFANGPFIVNPSVSR